MATPSLAYAAIPFIEKVKKRVCTAISDGVDWPKISAYYASVMLKVAQPTRDYAFGEGGSVHALFDDKWIEEMSTAREELERATQEKRAEAAAAKIHGGKRTPLGAESTPSKRELKRQKKAAAAAAASAKTATGTTTSTATAVMGSKSAPLRHPNVDATAAPVHLPSRGSADLTAVLTAFSAAHPKTAAGKAICFAYHQPQGCVNPKCGFAHE